MQSPENGLALGTPMTRGNKQRNILALTSLDVGMQDPGLSEISTRLSVTIMVLCSSITQLVAVAEHFERRLRLTSWTSAQDGMNNQLLFDHSLQIPSWHQTEQMHMIQTSTFKVMLYI